MSEPTPAVKPTFTAFGETFTVAKKPPTLLIAELARTETGGPEAVGILAEFFETVLGPDEYRRFKKTVYAQEVDDPEAMGQALQDVLAVTLGTPTQ